MRNSTISDVNLMIRFIEIIARFGKRRNLILTNCDLICGRRDERVFSRLIGGAEKRRSGGGRAHKYYVCKWNNNRDF